MRIFNTENFVMSRMERIENDDTYGNDTLYLRADELDDLEDEVGPNAHGDLTEGFETVVIELPNGRELEFTGYGGGSVSLDVNGQGLNGDSCIDCGEEKPNYDLRKIRGGPDNQAVYICRECKENHPINQLVG